MNMEDARATGPHNSIGTHTTAGVVAQSHTIMNLGSALEFDNSQYDRLWLGTDLDGHAE